MSESISQVFSTFIVQDKIRVRNTFFISLITGLIFTVAGIYAYFETRRTGGDNYLSTIVLLCVAGIVLLFSWLSRRGHTNLSANSVIITSLISLILLPLTGQGLGILYAFVAFIMAVGIAFYTLPPEQYERIIGLSLMAGIASLVIDTYAPQERNPTPITIFVIVIFAIIFIFYLYIFYRSYARLQMRIKLLITIITLIPMVLLIVSLFNNRSMTAALTNTSNQALYSAASQTAARIDTFLVNGLDDVRTEARLPDIVDFLSKLSNKGSTAHEIARVEATLTNLARKDPIYIASYALIDLNGFNALDTSSDDIGQDVSQEEYFRQPIQTGLPYVSPVLFDDTGLAWIYFSAPVRDSNAKTIGFIRVRYKADVLQYIISQANDLAGPGSYIVLVDENTVRLAHSKDAALVGKAYASLTENSVKKLQALRRIPGGSLSYLTTNQPDVADALSQVVQHPFFTSSSSVSGEEVATVAAVQLQNPPWIVLSLQDQSIAFAPIEAQSKTTIMIGVAITLAAVGASFVIANIFINPIIRLTNIANQVSQGNLDVRAKIESTDEIGQLAAAFNQMTAQLSNIIDTLEQRVNERTRALETSVEVSRRISTILDQNQLVQEIVEQLRNSFNYYHVQIYLSDQTQSNLLMMGGTGESGRIMLEGGHTVPFGRGLVGQAASDNQPVLVSDVLTDPSWLPNPLLPETKSEAAVPISIGENVLGVLDVQHQFPGGLQSADLNLLQSIANQVAVALQNARIYARAQNKAEKEAQIGEITQKIRYATTVDEALKVAVCEAGRAVGATETRIRLRYAESNIKHD
jgi:putative methionine-R-sulfoxide reductase with GAF domain